MWIDNALPDKVVSRLKLLINSLCLGPSFSGVAHFVSQSVSGESTTTTTLHLLRRSVSERKRQLSVTKMMLRSRISAVAITLVICFLGTSPIIGECRRLLSSEETTDTSGSGSSSNGMSREYYNSSLLAVASSSMENQVNYKNSTGESSGWWRRVDRERRIVHSL